jgi:hypothetical protein
VHQIEPDPEPGQPGRPPHVPTEQNRQTVSLMVAAGIPLDQIAPCIGIHWQTLTKHYAEEIATAATRANAKVAGSLFRKATSDEHPQAVTAAIWWTKSRMGWKGTDVNEHVGKDGGDIRSRTTFDFSDLDPDDRQQLRAILKRRIRQSEDEPRGAGEPGSGR